ncbi:MotA/TolQ/ExbB proton channel family protein [Novosphingobium profundi]|uniref:MotA/TolQ/ExbB proton channel family protein n=1 Tax=Novosphingobium profundi TaxID=1774954 RepID=UPI001BDAAD79|nr:MotA/TolQ/ExbB proton channel family protein [Novosphingobium profundi]MBT0667652.1 MotA/TolQ/ExbB proton channel family protein [Novosphingobium profundi]
MTLALDQTLHLLAGLLLWPVIAALLVLALLAVADFGLALGERLGGTARLSRLGHAPLERLARQRIARSDLLAKIAPTLGLMGTLIPLGPGIAALGRGDFQTLSQAITTAFDTTIVGLAIGLAGYLTGRLRRHGFERALSLLEAGKGETHA